MEFELKITKKEIRKLLYQKLLMDKKNMHPYMLLMNSKTAFNITLLILFILAITVDNINSIFKAIAIIVIILIFFIMNTRMYYKLLAILWSRKNEKEIHIKYGIYKASINEKEFKEEMEDFYLNVQLVDVKNIVENEDSFYVYTNAIMIAFSKKQFTKEDIYYYVLNIFKNALNEA